MKNVRRRGVCSGRCSLGVERIGRDWQRVPLWSFTSASPLLAVHAVLCVALSFVQGVSWYLLRSSAKYVCPLLHLVLWSASCTGMSSSKLVVPACPYAARALCFPFSSCESVALQRQIWDFDMEQKRIQRQQRLFQHLQFCLRDDQGVDQRNRRNREEHHEQRRPLKQGNRKKL